MMAQTPAAAGAADALTDRFGMAHRSRSPAAVAAFAEAVEAIAAHRPDAAAATDRALAADPDLVAAHATRAFGGVILARAETVAAARLAREAAQAAASRRDGPTADEAVLLAALDAAIGGRLKAAADLLDRHLRQRPGVLLLLKLSCSLRFMAGDPQGMRRTTSAVLPAWRPEWPGYGFVLGCHAFAMEETGDFAAAERFGRQAVAHEPRDAWGVHAVAHVFEMTGRVAEGIVWIERTRPLWTGCNNFAGHLFWHLALLHLERGDHAAVLALYDRDIRATGSEDFRDIANAVSLLWRLRQEGVAVGERWEELAVVARRRSQDTTLIFATLHHLLALAAVGDRGTASGALAALQRCAAGGQGEQSEVAARAGVTLARLLRAAPEGREEAPGLAELAAGLQVLGGSHAQRDLFVRILLERAAQASDTAAVQRLLQGRRALRCDDRFAARLGVLAGDATRD